MHADWSFRKAWALICEAMCNPLGCFCAGVWATGALQSLLQDWYGLDAWIEHVRANWVSPYYTVPVALLILVMSWAIYVQFCRHYDRLTKKKP